MVDRVLLVDAQPASDTRDIWTQQGLRHRWGLPLPDGESPVGEWVAFEIVGVLSVFGPAFRSG